MGYFSNNAENEEYQHKYCLGCVHRDGDKGCPVMAAHWASAGEAIDDLDNLLEFFIPMKDGINQKCAMFVQR